MRVITWILGHAEHLFTRRWNRAQVPRLGEISGCPQETSARRLNALAEGMESCTTYLEVGVAQGITMRRVQVQNRWGIDPVPQFNVNRLPAGVRFFAMRSDEFFETTQVPADFDLIFLDGLHEWRQKYRDLLNSLNRAGPNCLVLIDDVVPDDAMSAHPDHMEALRQKDEAGIFDGRWHGDVYKVLVAIRENHPELDFMLLEEPGAVNDNAQALL